MSFRAVVVLAILLSLGSVADAAEISVGIGVAIRSGAGKPDISTVDAFKSALLAAKSLSYAEQSQSGQYFAKLIERLGIAEAITSKATLMPGGAVAVVGPVARGKVEIAVSAISDILATEGVELLGPFPPELQTYVVYCRS